MTAKMGIVTILGVLAWGHGVWANPPAPGGPSETDKAYHYSNLAVEAEAAMRRGEVSSQNVPHWGRFEVVVRNAKRYANPYEDVTLNVTLTKPDGRVVTFWGFYDGGETWRIRFMPDQAGTWRYRGNFSDGNEQVSGTFTCVESDIPGMISTYEDNPIWFGFKGGEAVLVRSFHVGDRFFADTGNALTNEPWSPQRREAFLDWAQDQSYNMLSIASHYLNRDMKGRGKGWQTPDLWNTDGQRPNWREYRKVEVVLDDLATRRIMVYPFAGFFGRNSHFPHDEAKQDLYLRYTLARLGSYWNVLFMVGGPEPRLKGKPYLSADEINALGRKIRSLDPFGHLVSVHNPTGRDMFKDAAWTSYGILQGPKTTNREKLSEGLLASHHEAKPLYAQETLWPGNKYHPQYSPDDVRKNAFVLMMSAAMINYADMDGDSSSGFSGTMDLEQKVQQRHNIIRRVWGFFEDVPFEQMKPRQDLVDNGFCLAEPGKRYLVYLEEPGKVNILVEGGPYQVHWINAKNTEHVRAGGVTDARRALASPEDGDDWLLSLTLVDASSGENEGPKVVGRLLPDGAVRGL